VCPTALKYNLTVSMGDETGREVWGKYLERFVVTNATGPLRVLVAYFVLSLTKTAAESVAASAFGSK